MSKTVLASGVFDILHPGHLYYLAEARKFGDFLAVIVTSDETARHQGKNPIFNEQQRSEIIGQLRLVDQVVIGRSGQDYESIVDVWPAIIALGHDQRPSAEQLAVILKVCRWQGRIVRIGEMPQTKLSSSIIKKSFHQILAF